ncbi:putative inactive purple acid phosphatase 24 [Triticum urartu]|uniref:Putative inactive purple acid phosphatase 24 n=1 Tax=Triticum urartu TaxID=4572 RepID=M7ZCH3_TRIUA|nr:putative inactive purple acid phosphatase 24 [Triticum urartu]
MAYQFANYSSGYNRSATGALRFQLINQRQDFSFGFFTGGLSNDERDGSNEYQNYQPASLNTTDALIRDLDKTDIVFHIGDISYANGYLSQWDQFTQQVEPITSRVPYMIASGNHERDFPNSGSLYNGTDSGGECGVPAETMYYAPTEKRDNFCEHDWQEGTEQYMFLDRCLGTVDRAKQPWLVFIAHRVLGYSSGFFYGFDGEFAEPMARESLEGRKDTDDNWIKRKFLKAMMPYHKAMSSVIRQRPDFHALSSSEVLDEFVAMSILDKTADNAVLRSQRAKKPNLALKAKVSMEEEDEEEEEESNPEDTKVIH